MAYLTYSVDNGDENRLEIGSDINVIGRHSECTITIPDDMISRKHIEIIHKEDRFFVVDLGSRNGCFHNNKRITAMRELHDGDLLEMGKTIINFFNPDEPKETLKGYQLNNRISKGGMGTVYKGRQLSLDRIVAIKILHEKLSQRPKFVEQFQAEARAAGMLNHPNIIQVYDCGEENGRQFFAMEYVDGLTLRQLLNRTGSIDLREALQIGADICRGISFAHEKDIIHKDIKPENIMLTRDNKVKIADLGLAESFAAVDSEQGNRPIVGTPQYMPPEQANGEVLDERTDIYAIGGTLYHLICGHSVFPGKKSQTTLIEMQRSTPAPDLWEEMDGQISGRVSEMIMRCLEKKPKNRWRNCVELLEEIDACLAEIDSWNDDDVEVVDDDVEVVDDDFEVVDEVEDKPVAPKRTRTRHTSMASTMRQGRRKKSLTPLFVGAAAVIFGILAVVSYNRDQNAKIATYEGLLKREQALILEGKPIEALISHNAFIAESSTSHPRLEKAKNDIDLLLQEGLERIATNTATAAAMIRKDELSQAKLFLQELPTLPDQEIPAELLQRIENAGLTSAFSEANAVRAAVEEIATINSLMANNEYNEALETIDSFVSQHPRTKIAEHVESLTERGRTMILKRVQNIIENAQAKSDPKAAMKVLIDYLKDENPPEFASVKIAVEMEKFKIADEFTTLYRQHTSYLKENDYISALASLAKAGALNHPSATKIPREIAAIEKRILKTTEHQVSMIESEIKRHNFKKALRLLAEFTDKYTLPENCRTMLNGIEEGISEQIAAFFEEAMEALAQLRQAKKYDEALEFIAAKEKQAEAWDESFSGSDDKREIKKMLKQHERLIKNMRTYLPINPKYSLAALNSSVNLKGLPITKVDKNGLTFKSGITVEFAWVDVPKPFYTFLLLKYKKAKK